MTETYRYATTADLLRAIELVPVWTASLFKRWDDDTQPRTDAPILFRPFMGRSATFYTGHAARFITR